MASVPDTVGRSAADDFDQIWNRYSALGLIEVSPETVPIARYVHRFALSLALLARKVRARPQNHQKVFLIEAGSDAIHALHAILTGDARAARFYLRSVIENFWRHLFFKDHPVEFGWLESRPGYYKTIESLREYCGQLGIVSRHLKTSSDRLSDGFALLSRIVHSSTAPTLQLRSEMTAILTSKLEATAIAAVLKSFARDLLLMLAVIQASDYDKLHPREQRYLLGFLDAKRRRTRLAAHTRG